MPLSETATVRTLSPRALPILEPSATMDEALLVMADEPLRAVAIVGDGMYFGYMTEESARDLIPADVDAADLVVGPYVHPAKLVLTPDIFLADARTIMRRRGMRIAPVVDGVAFRGALTLDDIEGTSENASPSPSA